MNPAASSTELPYTDTKPVGAADFYTAINATFRFIHAKLGEEGLRRYWQEMGRSYYAPVAKKWSEGGLEAVAAYWRAFFNAEPGAKATVNQSADAVELKVHVCPIIRHLRVMNREIMPLLCQHCYFVSEAIAEPAGMTARVCGGNGTCTQRFMKKTAQIPPQNLEDITCAS